MYYIRFRDINLFNEIKNIIDVKTTDKPAEVVRIIKEANMINLRNQLFELSHIEFVPATKNGSIDCVDVYVDYYDE